MIGFQSWPGPRRPDLGGAVAASIDRKVGAFDPALRSRAYRRRYDSERAIRWLIALMVLCCDPLAIALTAAASARRA